MSTSCDGGKPIQAGLVDVEDIGFYRNPSDLFTLTPDDTANHPGLFSEIALNVPWI
jgi:hypothetical protein